MKLLIDFLILIPIFLLLALLMLIGIRAIGWMITIIFGMKRAKTREGMDAPSKLGIIIGMIFMSIPAVIVGGLTLLYKIL